jgi:surface-anchored protein
MLNAQGPGNVELFLQSGTQPTRIFSSRESLPDWTLDVPQHVHMNWAFSAAGTYRLTFEVEAVVDGKTQHARNDYVFVVGDLAKHQQSTTSSVVLVPGTDAPSLRASVTPAEARGAVQFVDRSTGAILGHVPVDGQIADFPLDQLPPGTYSLAAQFVPKWITDYKGSTSSPVEVTIAGEPDEKPGHDDVTAPTSSQLSGRVQGDGVKVVVERSPALPLDPISVSLSNADHFGKWVSVWLLGKNSAWQGWHRADLSGRFALTLAEDVPAGDYQFVVRSPDGTVLGWDSLKVGTGSSTQPTPTPTPQPTPKPTPKPTPDSGSTSKPKDKSQQKSKKTAKKKTSGKTEDTCTPAVTLDHGHIDAFYVSEAGGEAVMQLMEDVTGYHVLRAPETVLMKVKESANQAVASGMPGAPRGYVLPLTQDPALVWPGWDTNNTKSGGYTNVGIHVTKVAGPGTVHIHSQGSFGEVLSVLDGGRTSLPGVIRQAVPAHTHAQWVFSKKGVYELTAHAVLTNPDTGANVRTASHTYVFQVGDVPLGDVFCGAKPVDRDTARKVNAKVAERAKTALAADQAEEGLDQALDAVAADQADAVSALGAQTASLGGSDVRGDGNPQEVAGALGPESLEQSLAVLPLRAWIVIGLGLVVVMVATTYTAFRLGKNQRLSLGAVAA